MENCTEAFKMIILRLSERNCMECQDTFYHLDKCGKDMVLRNSLIVLEKWCTCSTYLLFWKQSVEHKGKI